MFNLVKELQEINQQEEKTAKLAPTQDSQVSKLINHEISKLIELEKVKQKELGLGTTKK